MTIVEISDYTMVIMKDSEDYRDFSISKYNEENNHKYGLCIFHTGFSWGSDITMDKIITTDFTSTGGRLLCFFRDKIPERFKKGDRVHVFVN